MKFVISLILCLFGCALATTEDTVHVDKGLIGSLVAIISLLVKQGLDTRGDKRVRERHDESATKIERLFQYNDKIRDQITDINKHLSVIDNHSKEIADLVGNIKEMAKTITEVQQDVTRLVTMQELVMKRRYENK